MRHAAVILALATTFAGKASAEQYVCAAHTATIFEFDNRWRPQELRTNAMFIVDTDAVTVKYADGYNLFDDEQCQLFDKFDETNMYCSNHFSPTSFAVNIDQDRFVYTGGGYITGDIERDSVRTLIGTCAELGG